MYILNVLMLFVSNLRSFGSPSNILLPVCFLAAVLLQFLLMERKHHRFRWIPAAAAAALVLLLEISIHIIHSYFALFLIIALTYAVVILLGVLCGIVLGVIFRIIPQKTACRNR